jgi:uncharacterized metal-binding protein YceD (DUF177 family)
VSDVPPQGFVVSVEATPAECAALCRRFGLEDLRGLSARLRIERARTRDGARATRVRASFNAQVVQNCVVTLEPFAVHVADDFELYFVPSAEMPDGEDSMSPDGPEPLTAPVIDLGELVAQHLALALDPYPRRPEAIAETQVDSADAADATDATDAPEMAAGANNPFAILGQLKHKM